MCVMLLVAARSERLGIASPAFALAAPSHLRRVYLLPHPALGLLKARRRMKWF
jgi:hypothetical protein